jgi:FHA domain/zinc-ribbon domain
MWRRRRGSAQDGHRGAESSASPDAVRVPSRRGWRARRERGHQNAWRMDPAPVSQVAWADAGEFTARAGPTDAVPAPSPWPAEERLGHEMPRVYCTRCGQDNPDGARFCSHCGIPLVRGGERPGESTSTISLGGSDQPEAEFDEPLADAAAIETLPVGTALLIVKRGPNAGSRFLLDSDLTTAGRHPESDIFLDDVTVSRRHAEFYRHPGGFTVRDVGSLNGTYVNRERIEEVELGDGDEVQVGKFRLMFLAGRRSQAGRGGGGAQVGA